MFPKEDIHSLFHLPDVLLSASVKRFLDDRLFGTRGAPKGALQGFISVHSGVDLRETVRAGKNRDEGVGQFFQRRVTHRLLFNLDVCSDGVKELQRANLDAESGEHGAR